MKAHRTFAERRKGSCKGIDEVNKVLNAQKTPSAPVRRNKSRIIFNTLDREGDRAAAAADRRKSKERSQDQAMVGPPLQKSMKPEDAAFFAWLVKRNIVPRVSGVQGLNSIEPYFP